MYVQARVLVIGCVGVCMFVNTCVLHPVPRVQHVCLATVSAPSLPVEPPCFLPFCGERCARPCTILCFYLLATCASRYGALSDESTSRRSTCWPAPVDAPCSLPKCDRTRATQPWPKRLAHQRHQGWKTKDCPSAPSVLALPPRSTATSMMGLRRTDPRILGGGSGRLDCWPPTTHIPSAARGGGRQGAQRISARLPLRTSSASPLAERPTTTGSAVPTGASSSAGVMLVGRAG